MQSASEQWFDEAYYQRFYFDKKTRVVDAGHAERLGAFVCHYLQYVRVPVQRVLDVGCGIGLWREAITRHFPGASYQGVEYSDYLCERYGWQKGSVVDYASAQPFDCLEIAPLVCDTHGEADGWEELKTLLSLRRVPGEIGYGIPTSMGLRVHADGRSEAIGGVVHRYVYRDGRVDNMGDIVPAFVVQPSEYEYQI